MFFKKVNSQKSCNVNIIKYMVNWNGKCRSKFQFQVKQWLKPYWANHVCLEEMLVPGSRMTFDLVNISKRVIVETSGSQHEDFCPHFHNNSRAAWLAQLSRDRMKREWAEQNDFILVEIFPKDLPLTPDFFKKNYDLDLA